MTTIDAFHLPGLEEGDVGGWQLRALDDDLALRWPVLEPAALERLLERMRRARAAALAERPVREIVAAIDAAAAALARPDDPRRAIADRALPAVTGHSPAMIRLILERMLGDWRAAPLEALLAAELGDPLVLDGFRPDPQRPGTRVHAYGPGLAVHVFAGNVPGVAVTSLVRSLLVKAATLGKAAAGEPLLPALFAQTFAAVAPELAQCVAVSYWPGGDAALEDVAFRAADLVVVYGAAETQADVRRRLPAGTRSVAHGPRISFGLIGRDALAAGGVHAAAAAAARATAIFDQQGCVSPHVFYVEGGGETEPRRFAELLAAEMSRLETELPRGRLSPAEAAAIQQVRGAAVFAALSGRDVVVHEGPDAAYTVIYDADPTFTASCLNRMVWVKPVDALEHVVDCVRPYASVLQTAGIAGAAGRLDSIAERLGRIGVSRVTEIERMPWPPPAWHHDGQEPLRELVRWTDLEE